jgi:hypothetical protein
MVGPIAPLLLGRSPEAIDLITGDDGGTQITV